MPRPDRLARRIDDYLNYLRDVRFASAHTLVNYERDLRHLAAWLLENEQLSARQNWEHVAHLHLRRYARSLADYSQATQQRRLTAIKSFFGWLEIEGVVKQNPALNLLSSKPLTWRADVLSAADIEKLMAAPDLLSADGKRDRALLEIIYGTGLRSAECVALTLADINWRAGELLIREENNSWRTAREIPKRVVFLGRSAWQALNNYVQVARPELASGRHTTKQPPVTDALWLSRRGLPFSQVALHHAVQNCARRAGFSQKITPQTLRHSCAAHLLQNGVGEAAVQELLGYRTGQVMRRHIVAQRKNSRPRLVLDENPAKSRFDEEM